MDAQCISQFCNGIVCGEGQLGERCARNQSCLGGKCSSEQLGVCTDGANGHACSDNAQCSSGYCAGARPGICTHRQGGEYCTSSNDCNGGTCPATDPLLGTCPVGMWPALALAPCADNGYCINGACMHSRCTGGETGDAGAD